MRTNCLLTGFTLTALLTGTAFGADPRLLNLVMPDATTMAGANVTNAEITPFGQYVLTQLTSSAYQELQTFITATGFDPRHDVTEILAASSANVANPSGLVLATGNFPVSQMTAAITAKAPTLTIQTYGGATLITGPAITTGAATTSAITTSAITTSASIAFLGTNIAIAGDTPSVKAAIDRSSGANSINTALAVQVKALSSTEDAWAVTDSPVSSLLAGLTAPSTPSTGTSSPGSQIGQLFSSIQGSSGGIKFGTTVQITGQAVTSSPANATSLASILQALVSIASMSGSQTATSGNGNQTGTTGSQSASLAQILQGLTVTTNGANINLALSIPETQIEAILNTAKTNQAAPALRVKPAIRPAAAVVAN